MAPLLGKLVRSVQVSRSSHTLVALLVSVYRERKREQKRHQQPGLLEEGTMAHHSLANCPCWPQSSNPLAAFSALEQSTTLDSHSFFQRTLPAAAEGVLELVYTHLSPTAFCCLTPRTEDRTGGCQHRARIPSHNMKMHESPQSQKLSHQCRRGARVAAKPAMNCCESI